jgi:hypothetical protein
MNVGPQIWNKISSAIEMVQRNLLKEEELQMCAMSKNNLGYSLLGQGSCYCCECLS